MKVQPRTEAPSAKPSTQPFLDERPRMFGANADDVLPYTEEYSEGDFSARWWPCEMDNRVAPRKPR